MTETNNWYGDWDLLKKLRVPKDFPRDSNGLPNPHKVGMNYESLVRRYLPDRKGKLPRGRNRLMNHPNLGNNDIPQPQGEGPRLHIEWPH